MEEAGLRVCGLLEPEAFQSLVLSERCGATKPRYLPDYRTIMDAVCREVFADYATPEILMEWQAAFAGRDWNDPEFDFPDSFAEMVLEGWGQRQPAADEMMRRDETVRKNKRVKAWPRGRVPNFGDLSQITDEDLLALGPVDILEGGSPCQAFSIAGKRLGLDDYRGNLTLQFVELAYRMQKLNGLKYVVWENVKGVLDARKGNGFGCLLGALAEKQGGEIPAPGERWTNAGMVSGPTPRLPGESSTLNISASPNDAKGSSLWQVLEKPRDPSDLKPYYLSAEQKATVLRNAGLRGSPLPELLERALKNS